MVSCAVIFLLITSHDLLRSFVKFQLIAHLLHRCSESFNLLLLLSDFGGKDILLLGNRRLEFGDCALLLRNLLVLL